MSLEQIDALGECSYSLGCLFNMKTGTVLCKSLLDQDTIEGNWFNLIEAAFFEGLERNDYYFFPLRKRVDSEPSILLLYLGDF